MSKIIELAKKLKALAEQGIGGEKINAQKMLAALCEKHGIDPALLDEEARTRQRFEATATTDTLLNQVIWMVCGGSRSIYKPWPKKYGAIVEVSEAERLEILAYYQVYARALKTALKDLEIAFCIKNRIFSKDDVTKEPEAKPLSPEARARQLRLQQMAEGLERTPVYKQLGEGK